VKLYALVEVDDTKAIDLFLSQGDAEQALSDCLLDEPEWRDTLRIAVVELRASMSPN